ncbi:MAG: GNAT family N-acetyltransferase [Acidobacteriota bacterium]
MYTPVAFVDPPPTDSEWAHCVEIRREVFCRGQNCPEDEEFDGLDRAARHLLLRVDGVPAATARWRLVESDGLDWAKLERFAVLEQFRGLGLGRHLVAESVAQALAAGCERMVLHAQAHLCDFYAGFGFRAVGPAFEEAGIPHRRMIADAASARAAADRSGPDPSP